MSTRTGVRSGTIAAIILTKNEEADLPDCLASLETLDAEIHIIDSGSSDRTLAIAEKHGAQILKHEFLNYSSQFNWALDTIVTSAEWILRIDADERISDQLSNALMTVLHTADADVTGVMVARRTQFLGVDIRWGDSYPVWLLRIFRRGCGRCEDAWMDEHITLGHGNTCTVAGDLVHVIPKTIAAWTRKHVWYAERECKDILQVTREVTLAGQASFRRSMKRNVYLRLPLFLRPCLYWLYRYFFRFGFLDGGIGFVYHFLHAFWYRLLVDVMLLETRRRGQSGS